MEDEALLPVPGFWPRAAAFIIDWLILGVIMSLAGGVIIYLAFNVELIRSQTSPAFAFFGVIFLLTYCLFINIAWLNHYYRSTGATPGKKAMGLKVVSASDPTKLLTTKQMIIRELIGKQGIGGATMGLSFLSALRKDGRSIHDLISDSRVIKIPE